jgi:glycosyltransferase involved in cell wall biosynthesis
MKGKVLHIAPTPFFSDRGCHIRIEGIVNCLRELGYENTVCTYHHGRDVDRIDARRIKPIKGYTQTEAGPSGYKLWADWRLLWLCVRQAWKDKPVVIHAHLHEGLFIAQIVCLILFWRTVPIIGDMQGSLGGELDAHGSFKKKGFLRRPVRWIEEMLMVTADHIICSSTQCLEKIKSEFNVLDKKISLAQDGANPSPEISRVETEILRERLAIPKERTIVVYTGALLDSKGVGKLRAVIKRCATYPELHFLIVGYPVENMTPFIEKYALQDNCTLTGQVDFSVLPQYLSLGDIAIDPKQSDAGEGSGKMLNYMAAGLPIAAFETVNNRQFLPTGTLLAATTAELADLVKALHESRPLRNQTGKSNEIHFIEHYSWKTTKSQLDNTYRDILA